MYGYLVADLGSLSEKDAKRYRSVYCGLCRTLKARHGTASQLTLNYDLTFLILLLGSLYEPEEEKGMGRCVPHPIEERKWMRSEISDYAADMNLALAYLKCLDDWQDEGSIKAKAAAGMYRSAFEKISKAYPRQCECMKASLDALHKLEKEGSENVDEAAACFGALMAEVLVYKEDRWSDVLRRFGMALGRFIYVCDACMDLDSDTLHNRYNPFRRYYGLDNEERFRDILRMLLGECVYYFDILPLVKDVRILKNILCDGLWQQFNKKYSPRKDASNVSGPV